MLNVLIFLKFCFISLVLTNVGLPTLLGMFSFDPLLFYGLLILNCVISDITLLPFKSNLEYLKYMTVYK